MYKVIVEEYDVEEGDVLYHTHFHSADRFLRVYGYEFNRQTPPMNGDWLEGEKYKDHNSSVKWTGFRARVTDDA